MTFLPTTSDNDLAPLSLGALTYGVTLENLVSSYIPYGNDGTHFEPHIIKWVKQGEDTLIYENDGSPRKAVSSETAYVMNKLLQNVVENGTGDKAKLQNKHVAGKTGTTENWYDLTFVGMTEDFVSGVWIDTPNGNRCRNPLNPTKSGITSLVNTLINWIRVQAIRATMMW